MMDINEYKNCNLCPRNCHVNRFETTGYCGEKNELKIANISPHYGEEPPISGSHGSGTVFFSGCSLKCCYCQNFQISHHNMGNQYTVKKVVNEISNLYKKYQIHNVNFVSPDHFFPHTIKIVESLRNRNIRIPILFNTSGYDKPEKIKELEDYADIYLPDFKYADKKLGQELSHINDYLSVAIDAIAEMVRQKGFLNSYTENKKVATRGVLVRHLILPGNVKNSCDSLSILYNEFGKEIPISLMSQYQPCHILFHTNAEDKEYLQRRITLEEFEQVYQHSQELGFTNMFVQFPENFKTQKEQEEYLPNFEKDDPFSSK